MSERREVCGLCVWWDRDFENRGFCRRNAPVVLSGVTANNGVATRWPITWGDDWCGAFAWDRKESDA